VEEIIARLLRIVPTGIADAVVNRVVPVVIVIGVLPVPAAIVRLKRIMRPANTGIGTGDDNVLPRVPKCPNLRRMRVLDPWFDRSRPRRRLLDRSGSRKVIMDYRVAFYSRHVRPGRQRLSYLALSLN
jgi:hypothetical protein